MPHPHPTAAPAVDPTRARTNPSASYLALAQDVRDAGLMQRRRGWYWRRMAAVVLTSLALAAAVVVLADTWWVLLVAPFAAATATQAAFLGHDAAHQQIFSSPRANRWAARGLANLLVGLGHSWWVGKHDVHHAFPNQVGRDTDIDSKVLAFHPGALDRMSGFHRSLLRHQGWGFFPLLLLEGLNLHVDSAVSLARRERETSRWIDVGLVAVRWAVYLSLLLLVLSPGTAALFLAVDLAAFGVFMGGAFAPGHTGMVVLPRGTRRDFLHRQVLACRNVSGGPVVGLLMGGLNRQVEHHLFPGMPRPNLRLVQPMVRRHCADAGITYTQTTLVGAYVAVVTHLNSVGLAARRQTSCPAAARLRS